MRWFRLLALGLLCWAAGASAQQASAELTLPTLTGRVVDQAELLSAPVEAQLTQMLAGHEQATTEQVVVVTVPDLQGRSIEEFGVQLGREWGIGQQGEDNGALLIVARDDRRMRIEVGYGLEGRLTDAQSSIIINQILTPAFRRGDFEGGIVAGTEAMIQVLGGDPLRSSTGATGERPPAPLIGGLTFFFMIILFLIGGGRGGRGRFGRAVLAGALLGGMGRGGGMGGGGGGFGGGGGGFGGGGASGGW
ncbi:methanol dehydrogenase [Pseudomonas sp. G11-1]|uniref:Methanol dehydrogenase n=1 Tax=Halopseudomonas bauzanensis TaxID=653930 RepID=A0A031MIR3_9GAMM|nr:MULTISPECIES: TPM domain-containing protein [Halopseudomonas]MCO5784765.1 methanol dehydrogenase [Pseudomonas sp. G11-1]MCO5789132.1 methanol dehydrogenase [Pseudomonas sp. G11-2]EZQ19890.1 methanol dehydrogenase [Halopseudomonas bauzanensis]TKA91677.1 methanol dehydrogenase [Halopseudomonas bauzanensis]WGK60330.1 TPM domain-containing protein [Halopseudomonas sp. SMJS2]